MKKKNNYFLIIQLIVLHVLIGLVSNYFLSSDDLIYNFYSGQLAKEQIEQLLESQKKWTWVGYSLIFISAI